MRWRWLWALLPAFILLVVLVLVRLQVILNLQFDIRIDLLTLLVLLGVSIYLLIILIGSTRRQIDRIRSRAVATTQQQAADERRRFLQRLDHELKNPLMAIRAGVANLGNGSDRSGQDAAITSVVAQATRLSRLSADLRKLADLETRPLEDAPINMAELLRDVIDMAQERPEAEHRHLALSLPQAWPLPAVNGDHDLLFLAIFNLVDNALKFTQPGDTIELRGFENEHQVIVEVADTGPGIADDDVPHVWEELYRAQSTQAVPGTGLGMALVRAIVARHGGQVSLRSRLGQGTVVMIRLPVRA